MNDEDRQHDLFKLLDAIKARITELEKVIAGPCGMWEWDQQPFFVARYGGRWRIMDKSDPAFHKPVIESPIERRIEFAKVSKAFIAAYVDWKTDKLNRLKKQAQDALGDML